MGHPTASNCGALDKEGSLHLKSVNPPISAPPPQSPDLVITYLVHVYELIIMSYITHR